MWTPIPFSKMNGSGNDFILIDNRSGIVGDQGLAELVGKVCRRKLSVGADGLILIEDAEDADFRWQFFNADGSRAEMCGNGARCAARFAHMNGIAASSMVFETDAGRISAKVEGDRVRVGMTTPFDLVPELSIPLEGKILSAASLNTGVPHVVVETDELERVDVDGLGRAIRRHGRFSPAGTNVNFTRRVGDRRIAVRTYERGVEAETLACGTGCVASALITARRSRWSGPVEVETRGGGVLTVHFDAGSGGEGFSRVFLEGDARMVYTAQLMGDALAG